MKQFDLVENNSRASGNNVPYLLILQSDSVSILPTKIVAPVRAAKKYGFEKISKLHIILKYKDEDYIAFISEMAAVPIELLGEKVSRFPDMHNNIIAAIDLLFTGF